MKITATAIDRVPHLLLEPADHVEREQALGVFPPTVGTDVITVLFNVANAAVLQAWGHTVPPMHEGYGWHCRYPPWGKQKEMAAHLMRYDRTWLLSAPRTGKTLSVILAAHRLMLTNDVKRVLILAPKTILRSSWLREWAWVAPQELVYVADKTVAELEAALLSKSPEYRVFILNTDKVRYSTQVLKIKWDLVVADEATKFKNARSERSRALNLIVRRPSVKFWPLTGTPCPTLPTDVWHVGRMVNPSTMPPRFTAWREKTMYQIHLNWLPRVGWKDMVARAMVPSYRVTREECFEVPPISYTVEKIDMTAEQVRNIRNIAKHQRTILSSGASVSSPAKSAAIQKVYQVAGGVIYADDGTTRLMLNAVKARVKRCIAAEQESGSKVIVVCPYTDMHDAYAQVLAQETGTEVLSVRGSTTAAQRLVVQDRFREEEAIRFLVAHPEPVQFGVNASKANTTVWVSPMATPEQFIQVNDRMFAELSEQKQKLDVIMLAGCKAEYMRYSKLRQLELGQTEVLDDNEVYRTLFDDEQDRITKATRKPK